MPVFQRGMPWCSLLFYIQPLRLWPLLPGSTLSTLSTMQNIKQLLRGLRTGKIPTSLHGSIKMRTGKSSILRERRSVGNLSFWRYAVLKGKEKFQIHLPITAMNSISTATSWFWQIRKSPACQIGLSLWSQREGLLPLFPLQPVCYLSSLHLSPTTY